MPMHLGINIREKKDGLRLTRENYAIVNQKSSFQNGKTYTLEWCEKHLKNCLENFDLNVKYFSGLERAEFSNAVKKFLQKNKEFNEVTDLNNCHEKSGYYMMVLDDYCQVYIGTAKDIKRRIQSHWSKTQSFDRLIFGGIEQSRLSIDSFRAYDTTRVYAYITSDIYAYEDTYINDIPAEFSSNRTSGGLLEGGVMQAMAMGKMRQLTK